MLSHDAIQIRLAELQIKTQEITSEYQTQITISFSLMISMVVLLFALAMDSGNVFFSYFAVVVAVAVYLFQGLLLHPYYTRKLDEIDREIQVLKEQCL